MGQADRMSGPPVLQPGRRKPVRRPRWKSSATRTIAATSTALAATGAGAVLLLAQRVPDLTELVADLGAERLGVRQEALAVRAELFADPVAFLLGRRPESRGQLALPADEGLGKLAVAGDLVLQGLWQLAQHA